MTRRVEYTPDSIQRALDHHVTTGALSSTTRSGEALRPAWIVEYDGPGSGSLRLSIKEAHVLCIGLARGETEGRKMGQEKAARTVATPSTTAPTGVSKVLVDLSGVDFAMLRAQKHALDILSAESGHGWAAGVVNFLDDISDKAALILGDRVVFGPRVGDLAYVGVGECRSCGSAIALDETGSEAVWVDATGGDVCCGGDGEEDGESVHGL
ncbi:MAG: hypothetical protein ACYCST_10050 [Acidimicrobiales bacterium]